MVVMRREVNYPADIVRIGLVKIVLWVISYKKNATWTLKWRWRWGYWAKKDLEDKVDTVKEGNNKTISQVKH